MRLGAHDRQPMAERAEEQVRLRNTQDRAARIFK
jgi:hypothetical protein